MKTLRIVIERTARTDLVCIHCGGFMTEFAVVAPGTSEKEAETGVHRRCIDLVKYRRSAEEEVSS